MATALYMAHLNPLTRAHESIIRRLLREAGSVVVMPVVFERGGSEVNSRSFPFSFEARREMVSAVFGGGVGVSRAYAFGAPFARYLPPLISPHSWALRRRLARAVPGDYYTYTGDRAEGHMLRAYRLRPRVGERMPVSASSVRESMYADWGGGWRDGVPAGAARVIEGHREAVARFAGAEDRTVRVAGMKFPKDGFWPSLRRGGRPAPRMRPPVAPIPQRKWFRYCTVGAAGPECGNCPPAGAGGTSQAAQAEEGGGAAGRHALLLLGAGGAAPVPTREHAHRSLHYVSCGSRGPAAGIRSRAHRPGPRSASVDAALDPLAGSGLAEEGPGGIAPTAAGRAAFGEGFPGGEGALREAEDAKSFFNDMSRDGVLAPSYFGPDEGVPCDRSGPDFERPSGRRREAAASLHGRKKIGIHAASHVAGVCPGDYMAAARVRGRRSGRDGPAA